MKILIACGGTAGHIFPGLALAEELKGQGEFNQIIIVASDHPRDKEYLKVRSYLLKDVRIETVVSAPLPYNFSFVKYILFIWRLLWAFLKSFIIILKYRPAVVVGFGGYTSFAPLIIARIIGIPTLIHEQNLVPGRANRLLARIADKVTISFGKTKDFFSQTKPETKSDHRIVKTGLPLRRHIFREIGQDMSTKDKLRKNTEKFTILVVGGSQGAHNINELVLNCLSLMDKTERKHLHLIHIAGKRDLSYVKTRYGALGVNSQIFDFLEDIAGAYRITDLLIGRSGAGTIFEAATFGLPCILIPYSRGTKHQRENALYLEHLGSAIVLDEETADALDLKKMLLELIANKRMRQDLSQRIKMLQTPQATQKLKEQVFALCRGANV